MDDQKGGLDSEDLNTTVVLKARGALVVCFAGTRCRREGVLP